MKEQTKFTARRQGDSDKYDIYRKTWLEAESGGRTIKVPNDGAHDEDGHRVGQVDESAPGIFLASFRTTEPTPTGGRAGRTVRIEGQFKTLEDAVAAIEANYDPSIGQIVASPR